MRKKMGGARNWSFYLTHLQTTAVDADKKIHFLHSVTWHVSVSQFCLALEKLPTHENPLEVHGAISQVVFPPNVGDLLGLHGLQLRTVCNTMAETTAECAAPLSCENTNTRYVRKFLRILISCQTHRSRSGQTRTKNLVILIQNIPLSDEWVFWEKNKK